MDQPWNKSNTLATYIYLCLVRVEKKVIDYMGSNQVANGPVTFDYPEIA